MKKILFLLLCLVSIGLIPGCGSDKADDKDASAQQKSGCSGCASGCCRK